MKPTYEYKDLKINQIVKDDTYKTRSDLSVDSLVTQIESEGQLVPIIVEPAETSGYRIICGFRRTEAIRTLHKTTIQAKIMYGLLPEKAHRISIVENLERGSLTPWDIVSTALKLRKQGYINKKIAEAFGGVTERTIQRYLRVAEKASDEYKRALQKDDLTIQQVYEAIRNDIAADEMLTQGRSVRYLRDLARQSRAGQASELPDVVYTTRRDGGIFFRLRYKPGDNSLQQIIGYVSQLLRDLRMLQPKR